MYAIKYKVLLSAYEILDRVRFKVLHIGHFGSGKRYCLGCVREFRMNSFSCRPKLTESKFMSTEMILTLVVARFYWIHDFAGLK